MIQKVVTRDSISINDIGTSLQVNIEENDVAVDVSSATAKQIIIEKPDGTLLTKTAAFVNDGTDGKIQYTTVTGDIDQVGIWRFWGKVTFAPESVFHTADPIQFRVAR